MSGILMMELSYIGDLEEVAKSLDIIRETGPGLEIHLNIHKMKIYWLSCDRSKLHKGLFPADVKDAPTSTFSRGSFSSKNSDSEAIFSI
jgi:hypothetical protein